jgi:hypothetical protein
VTVVPENAHKATTYREYDIEDFLKEFSLSYMPKTTQKLAQLLKENGYSANISFKPNSATAVSNFINFFTHPTWASSQYHVISLEDDARVKVIKKNMDVIEEATTKKEGALVAHNHLGELVLYEFL